MKPPRSTAFWAWVPSQTETAITATSITSVPYPTEGTASGMLPSGRRVFDVGHAVAHFLAERFIAHDSQREDGRKRNAQRPRNDNAPENPVGEPEHKCQAVDWAVVAIEITVSDRVEHRRQPGAKGQ